MTLIQTKEEGVGRRLISRPNKSQDTPTEILKKLDLIYDKKLANITR